ncbi:MAG: NADH-quinone oxidoreductase subunit C [Anaerolinea sp.]|nr:NADH-quinone oxidoreductase subunit C [Anaerolinea sp.]
MTQPAAAPQYPGISALIHKHLSNVPFTATTTGTDADIHVAAEHLLALVEGMNQKPELAFDMLANVTGIDMGEDTLAVKYNLYSFTHNHRVQVTVTVAWADRVIPSLTGIYRAADWHEREAAEMVGVVFAGHPNPKNLLLDEDLRIHPLLKSHPLQTVEILQGIEEGVPGFKF